MLFRVFSLAPHFYFNASSLPKRQSVLNAKPLDEINISHPLLKNLQK